MFVCCQTRVVGEIVAVFPAIAKSSLLLGFKGTAGFQVFANRESSLLPEFKPVLNLFMAVSK